ncbi:UDP-2,4-diacetamido-2,4,6-trideoxy-beta-L-altropyranose hydrolase [Geosporobacter ferrireducens]|uniref:UDP-2,4-diacetamido-2,4, 6-trideoxy-beta-L-altropyranose hydrolase n=1 Tax=Geosporobacter ferrireducens TaxID=1424294 RepID=A0A1D8GEM2_9FIRM|nr:UDP-2,4-diacetamido-2,4,6-trideoxy-beta-L-altropyranose hydrolase [Geosporobacter ferrireducens]AOT69330.1 UDP-2,4-diacetamido-2,4,6-trideoxy-beta-L-altropyranose hydrolase [Geosporobacter ferrireducens]
MNNREYVVGIRADGGQGIGMGHIMRCLALAREFRRKGNTVYFICKAAEGAKKIIEEGFEVLLLDSGEATERDVDFNLGSNLLKEAYEMVPLIDQKKIAVLIIDTYDVSIEYFSALKTQVKKLVYIDDLKKAVYPVDMIINGNLTSEYMNYQKDYGDQLLLLGPTYNMIREEFINQKHRKIHKQVRHIMITTGGTDPHHMTSRLLDMILSDNKDLNLTIHLIIGSLFRDITDLKKIEEQDHRVILHENTARISDIMRLADIGISAGGTTLYELAACGTPTLAFILAENQEFLVGKMDEAGYVISLGWFHQIEASGFLKQLKALINNYTQRVQMSRRAQKLVDGRGIERIVIAIDKMMKGSNESSSLLL